MVKTKHVDTFCFDLRMQSEMKLFFGLPILNLSINYSLALPPNLALHPTSSFLILVVLQYALGILDLLGTSNFDLKH